MDGRRRKLQVSETPETQADEIFFVSLRLRVDLNPVEQALKKFNLHLKTTPYEHARNYTPNRQDSTNPFHPSENH